MPKRPPFTSISFPSCFLGTDLSFDLDKVIDNALEQSGCTREDIDYLALLHMKRSAFEYVAKAVGVDPYTQAIYLEEIGHNGQNDGIISLEYGIKSGKIKDGDIVVLTAAGIGWAWNAGVIRWG